MIHHLDAKNITIAVLIFVVLSFVGKFLVFLPIANLAGNFLNDEYAVLLGLITTNVGAALVVGAFLANKVNVILLYNSLVVAVIVSSYKVLRPDMSPLEFSHHATLVVASFTSVMAFTYICKKARSG